MDINIPVNEIILYQPNNTVKLEVRLEHDETVWLNRQQMAVLFCRDIKTIGKLINNALKEYKTRKSKHLIDKIDNIRVVQKLQFLNQLPLKTAKCGAFCKTCSATNRVVEQVHYLSSLWFNAGGNGFYPELGD